MKKMYSALASILGFAIIVLYALKNASALFTINSDDVTMVLGYFDYVQQYLIYALAGLAGLELVAGKRLLGLIFFVILAFVVITTFFPGVIDSYIPS